uniref:Uncharacterized protein n=1 Tax=Rhizophora mucronata TaxID=61149 RepID=A0A2P2Q4T2_RHIMU
MLLKFSVSSECVSADIAENQALAVAESNVFSSIVTVLLSELLTCVGLACHEIIACFIFLS